MTNLQVIRASRGEVRHAAAAFPALAKEAAQQWTATFNPRPITAEDFEQLYEEVLG